MDSKSTSSESEEDVPQNRSKDSQKQRRRYQDEEEEEWIRYRAQNKSSNSGPLVDNPTTMVGHNWQAKQTTMMDRLKVLLFSDVMSDVTFLVGVHKERIKAHKFILSISSSVFEAMFYGKLASQSHEIELPDVEPVAFRNLLKHIYLDNAFIGPENVMTTLYTAKKYAVPKLEKYCVEFLECNLCSENAFLLLSQARLFDETKLIYNCLDVIDKKTQDSLDSEGFIDLDLDTLQIVVKRDTLRVREIKLYEAILRWADAQCRKKSWECTSENRKIVLGTCINLIRYPLMSVEEFASGPAQHSLLKDSDIVQLFLYFTLNPKPYTTFSDIPRSCMIGRECVANRFLDVESRWGYNGTSDRIRFQVDRRIFMAGLGLYGSVHGPAEYDVTIQIIHTLATKVIGFNKTKFTSDGSSRTFRVMFTEPVEITPNIDYTALATLKGDDSYYGTKGLRKVILQCSRGDKVTFQFSYAAGNNNGSSVEDGQIPEFIFYT